LTNLIMLVLLFFAISANAQDKNTVINSNPPGAFISLDGDYRVNATTPCRLPGNIAGSFRLKAKLPGYESWNGNVMIIPGQDNTISFMMSPKTRIKAALRSLFMPGWGQYYSGQETKALITGLGTIGVGIGAVIADRDFRNKRNDYFQAKIDLENALTYDEAIRLRNVVQQKNRKAYDAETNRNVLLGITIGAWAYNVLDAMVFFPEHRLIAAPPAIQAGFDGDMTTLKLTATF
jgi:hypothetical protein